MKLVANQYIPQGIHASIKPSTVESISKIPSPYAHPLAVSGRRSLSRE